MEHKHRIKDINPDWEKLLVDAVNKPGHLSKCYELFHSYSFGNQLLAMMQCYDREIELGPVNTFNGWKELGRTVKKGQNALQLCMPVNSKFKKEKTDKDGKKVEEDISFTKFIYPRRWFVLSQTEGDVYVAPPIPGWSKEKALKALDIEQIPYAKADGNVQGYAVHGERKIAINPVAALPNKTLFHEIAHQMLGHTDMESHNGNIPKDIKEAEAESVAYILTETLGLGGSSESRGYIQDWLKDQTLSEDSARKILSTASKILEAGK